MNLRDSLRAQSVMRWNVLETLHTQSIAEHMWNVTIIATEITLRIKIEDPAPPGFIGLCLKHDRHEVFAGDVPTPTKQKFNSPEYPDMWRYTAEEGIDPEYDSLYLHYQGTVYEAVLKLADIIEGEWFLRTWGIKCDHRRNVLLQLDERYHKALDIAINSWPSLKWEEIPVVRGELAAGR